MTPKQQLESILSNQYESEDGDSVKVLNSMDLKKSDLMHSVILDLKKCSQTQSKSQEMDLGIFGFWILTQKENGIQFTMSVTILLY